MVLVVGCVNSPLVVLVVKVHVASQVHPSKLVVFDELRSDRIWPSDVKVGEFFVHVISILNFIDDGLGHHQSKWMILGHRHESIISVHVRSSAHHELIVFKVQPRVHVLHESHFGIHVNSSVIPKCHPPP